MATVTDNAVTTTTAAVAAPAPVQTISGGQIVAKMLKQEGIKHIFWVAWIWRELRKFRPVYLPR